MSDMYDNLNKLSSNRATLHFSRFPNLTFTLQRFPLPGINLGVADQSSPLFDKPVYGDKLYFGDLYIEFAVSENMKNWYEVFKWMWDIANPSEHPISDVNPYADATMVIYTSHNNPMVNVKFLDVIPVSLGELDFSEQTMETTEIYCMLVLKYQRYDIEFIENAI